MDDMMIGAILAFAGLTDIVLANVLRERFTARVRTFVALTGVGLIALGGAAMAGLVKISP